VEKKSKTKKKPTVEVNRSFCKGCGICVAFCPKEVLELDDHEKAVVKRPEQCNACMLCELRCPDIAIEVRSEEQGEEYSGQKTGDRRKAGMMEAGK
jgi:2-oxoglutarate ferredoxin oxidoreductase subunit delta